MPQSHKEKAHCQTSTTQGLHKISQDKDVSFKAKEGNLSERRGGVTGALLISFQIKSQLFTRNKGSQWGNQPPEGQMVSAQSPLTPPALALSDRAARAPGETGHPANPQSTLLVQSVYSHDTVQAVASFVADYFLWGCLVAKANHEYQIWSFLKSRIQPSTGVLGSCNVHVNVINSNDIWKVQTGVVETWGMQPLGHETWAVAD